MHFTVSKSAEQLSLKLMGISPLHGSHPAVPFACGATSSHGLRLYGSIIITIERSWRQLCGKLFMERWQESLSGFIPPFMGHGVPAQRLSFYRNVFGCVILRWLGAFFFKELLGFVSLWKSIQVINFHRVTKTELERGDNKPNPVYLSLNFHFKTLHFTNHGFTNPAF